MGLPAGTRSVSVFVVNYRKPAPDEREIDLLLLHPEHGMLALEVTGGGIDYDLRGMGGPSRSATRAGSTGSRTRSGRRAPRSTA